MPPQGVPSVSHDSILSYEEIVRIAHVAVSEGIRKIRITGGEPLVRKGVVGLVNRLSQMEEIEDLSMTTNGILLAEYAQALYDAGLMRVNVSMDSLRPELFRDITRGGDLSLVWKGIDKAEAVGLQPIKINVVAIKGFNDGEVLDFARLTMEHAYHVRFIEFMPVGQENGWHSGAYLSGSQIKQTIEEHFRLSPAPLKSIGNNGPAELFRIDGAQGMIGFINAISRHFCSSCNRLRLTADGKLRPCLFSDAEIDMRWALRQKKSDDDIRALLHSVLSVKPAKHTLAEPSFRKCAREMVSIGG